MPNSCTEIYLHFVWGTRERKPSLTPQIEKVVYDALRTKCHDHKCQVQAIGGVADHVHVLVRIPPTLVPATLVHDLKGSSSHLVRQQIAPGSDFGWQGAYAVLSVSPSDIPTLVAYIENQKQHHARKSLDPEWELPDAPS